MYGCSSSPDTEADPPERDASVPPNTGGGATVLAVRVFARRLSSSAGGWLEARPDRGSGCHPGGGEPPGSMGWRGFRALRGPDGRGGRYVGAVRRQELLLGEAGTVRAYLFQVAAPSSQQRLSPL